MSVRFLTIATVTLFVLSSLQPVEPSELLPVDYFLPRSSQVSAFTEAATPAKTLAIKPQPGAPHQQHVPLVRKRALFPLRQFAVQLRLAVLCLVPNGHLLIEPTHAYMCAHTHTHISNPRPFPVSLTTPGPCARGHTGPAAFPTTCPGISDPPFPRVGSAPATIARCVFASSNSGVAADLCCH